MTQQALNFQPVPKGFGPAMRAANYIGAAKSKDDKTVAVAIWAHFMRVALR